MLVSFSIFSLLKDRRMFTNFRITLTLGLVYMIFEIISLN